MAKDPNDLVRVTHPSGGEGTVRRSYAVKHGLKIKEGKPVTHRGGKPVPFKPKVSLPPAGGGEGVVQPDPGDPSSTNSGSGEPPALMS